VGLKTIGMSGGKATLTAGQTLETDRQSQASITVAEIGRVGHRPRDTIAAAGVEASRTRLKLERGTIHAFIWAPPGGFMVDTPSALAVDLGCRYTLACG